MTRQHERTKRVRSMEPEEINKLYLKWDETREQVDIEEEQFLRDRGWVHSSDNPIAVWLWKKNGFTVDRVMALELELAEAYRDQSGKKNDGQGEGTCGSGRPMGRHTFRADWPFD